MRRVWTGPFALGVVAFALAIPCGALLLDSPTERKDRSAAVVTPPPSPAATTDEETALRPPPPPPPVIALPTAARAPSEPNPAEEATWLAREARVLAKASSPAAVGRFAEAIATARRAKLPDLVAELEKELSKHRDQLKAREIEYIVARSRSSGMEDDGTHDEEEYVRDACQAIAERRAAPTYNLADHLHTRAVNKHLARNCEQALLDLALARRILAASVELKPKPEAKDNQLDDKITKQCVRCRLEAGGRAIQNGDGPLARALMDLAELQKLDGTASGRPRVLYFLGRALEADAEPEEARKHYLAAIGSAPWLEQGTAIEVVRWLARCRAASRGVWAHSPGVNKSWRIIRRARFVLVTKEWGVATLPERIEKGRAAALARLGFGDPIRVEATKPVVIVFQNREEYMTSGMAPKPWAGGHAARDRLQDGDASTLVVYETEKNPQNLDDTLVHEWAHILVGDHLQGAHLPSWAVEGVAEYTEPLAARSASLRFVTHYPEVLSDWAKALTADPDPRYTSDSGDSAGVFYAQALLGFETAMTRMGSPAAVLRGAIETLKTPDEVKKLVKDETTNWRERHEKIQAILEKRPFELLGFKDAEDFAAVASRTSSTIHRCKNDKH